MMLSKNKKAQSAVEYAILLVIIMGAFLAGGHYFKRGVQGRWKAVVDDLGEQYDPRVADTSLQHTLVSNTDTVIMVFNTTGGYWTKKTDQSSMEDRKTGMISIDAY